MNHSKSRLLITGMAGFIGYWLARYLMESDSVIDIVGVDNLNDYYEPELKLARLRDLGFKVNEAADCDNKEVDGITSERWAKLRFIRLDVADHDGIMELMSRYQFTHVMHLAAQAGVRYSITHPYDYLHSNLDAFLSILEGVRHYPVKHFVYASSSSVYGANSKIPFREVDRVDEPVSLYAATKKSNELMASAYSRLYGIRATGLRFFTVYGPWGRPDMAPMIFARKIMRGEKIEVFNYGDMKRDFTYVQDIVSTVARVLFDAPGGDTDDALCQVYNIGHGSPVSLMDFISTLEGKLGCTAQKVYMAMQPGDVPVTWADTTALQRA